MLRTVGLLALALASGSAHALGLGQIQVKSGLGQPLLAEIPVISNDPSELVDLDAALASPETFTRIGLEPPVGIVADLHFVIGSDAQGRPVIRITTTQPVTQPLLNFLIEVDWGQGRLVREYTAAVAGPGSIAAQPVEPVEAPAVEAAPVIERPAPVAAQPQSPTQPAAQVSESSAAVAPERAPSQPEAAPQATTGDYPVRAGDSASEIASRIAPDGVSAAQAMIGLLRANPRAFIDGDLNRIRSGSVLRVPTMSELQAIEAREAADLVRTYARQWRRARSVPQATSVAQADASTRAPAAASGGRLEIVPPGAGQQARGGTQSGIAAGGEGDMVRQELQQTKETLAARDAEVQELKGRVAELERLQADQQKLIAMQNSQLHASQQQKAAEPPAEAPSTPLPWIAGGALVLLGVLAAAWNRRRSRREPVFRAPTDPARPSVADAFAVPAAASTAKAASDVPAADSLPSWERGGPRAARGFAEPTAADRGFADGRVAPAADVADGNAASAERLELAQAYLDLGDTDNARRLLGEVAESGDAATRGVAARMLRDIG